MACNNIVKNRMSEGHYIEKMLSETKQKKLFGMAYRIMNAIDWGCQKELSLLEQLDTQKLKSENKIK